MIGLRNNHLDKDDPWSGILADTDLAVRSMCHTMLQSTSIQMVLVHDMILNTPFVIYWESVMRRKQQPINKNNQNKNINCKPHYYTVREKVLVCDKKLTKYEEPYKVLYPITKVCKL